MSENPSPRQSESLPSTEPGKVVIDERTVENLTIPEIKKFLIERMNPDSGICDKLLSSDVLTKLEDEDVTTLRTSAERNARLLEIITEKEMYREFLNALSDTQGHLVNYITGNGVYSNEYRGIWPLREREIKILKANWQFLVENLDTEIELIGKLFSLKVISRRQKVFLNSQKDEIAMNKALLDILWRSSLRDYQLMINCLCATKQFSIARILVEGGVIVPVHNTLEVDGETVPGLENNLVDQIRDILGGRSLEDACLILEAVHLKLFYSSPHHSIILYFWCQKMEELLNLRDLLHSGELKKTIERFFNKLTTGVSNITVTVSLPTEVFDGCQAFLEASDRQDTLDQQIMKLCELDPVLEAQMQQMEEQDEEMGENKEDKAVPEPMDVLEEEIQQKDSFGIDIEPMEAEESQKEDPCKIPEQPAARIVRTAIKIKDDILRNNTEYLVYHMFSRGLLNQLRAKECLTDEETRYIKTLRHDRDKNVEILKVIRNRSLDTYNKFIEVLRLMDQHIIAEVVEKGGVVVKASVTIDEEQKDSETIKKELVNRINQVLSKNGPVKPQLLHFFCLLKRNGLDILSAKHEKDIILWIWCRSEAALEQLDKMKESNLVLEDFNKILTGLFWLLLDNKSDIPVIINVNLEDTDRRFVCHTPCLNHSKDLQIDSQNVCGIAELDEKFYILSKNPSKINEFESLDSTDSKTLILSSVKDPVEIMSSDEHHCLYISDTGNSSIWKATADDRKVTQWLENISNPFTMSLTKDEHILLLRRDQPATIEVYDSNAKQIWGLALPSNIVRPIHTVKSLTGSFFISFRGENEGQSGICEMTKNGDTVTLFDSSINRIEGIAEDINQVLSSFVANKFPSSYPEYLALDQQGNLYATDPHNSRLMLLDGRLNLETVLRKDLINMHLAKFQKQMMVLHGANQKTISVVDMQ